MKKISVLLILTILISCSSSVTEEIKIENRIYNTPPNIEGKWRYIRNEIIIDDPEWDKEEYMIQEWTYFYNPYRADIIIEGDSLYRTEYPMELHSRGTFDIGSCFLKTYGNIGISRYVLKDDTLILYREDERNFVKEYFKKTDYSDSTMSILKQDTINYGLLDGTWYLQRSYNYGDDGSEYFLNYPHTVPDSFNLSREHILKSMHTGKQVKFLTDGVMRTYTYDYVGYWLNLTPGDWYTGEEVVLEFERYEDY